MITPRTPRADGYFMPPEWGPHARCWMAWPMRESLWPEGLERAREAFARVAATIAEFEPVTMIADPGHVADVSLRCGNGVGCMPMQHDDSWLRDSGATFVIDGNGTTAGVDWIFNGWGERYTPFDSDAAIARTLLARLGLTRYEAGMVLEGGAIDTDGRGTVLTSESVVLEAARNAGMTKADAEHELCELLGASHVIWLGEGLTDDTTTGHVANLARFVAPGKVVALTSRDRMDANYAALQDNLERLRAARDARGEPLEIVELPQPKPRHGTQGERLGLSHVNFTLVNGGVLVPMFDDGQDDGALDTLSKLFPARTPIQVHATEIVRGGAGLHSITLCQPTGQMRG